MLTPAEAQRGFALAGVRQREAVPAESWEILREAMADPDIGVIAVDARLLTAIAPGRLQELSARWSGVLVTLPAPAGAARPEDDELQRLVRRALGYHVKL
jgi:V/A-type H+-transporting ATPase subunit F